MAKKKEITIRSSAAEYLTFITATGEGGIEAIYADENVWLSQKMMGVLYDVGKSTINYHLHTKDEQKRIADYLDKKCAKIDAIIEKQQEIIEKLREYKLSVITEAVTKGLNSDVEMKDSGLSFVGKIPKTWKLSKMKYNAVEIGDGLHSTPVYDSE